LAVLGQVVYEPLTRLNRGDHLNILFIVFTCRKALSRG